MAENKEQQGMEEELRQAREVSAEADTEENGDATSGETSEEEHAESSQTSGEEHVESSQTMEEGSSEENPELLQLKDKYLRTLAEYENFRKRSEKEKAQMFELGAKSIIEALLPVVDNFERALSHVQEEEKDSPFVKGIEGIYKQIQKMFADCNIQEIEALGKKFDPALHNAVMTEEEGDAEEDTITQDLQKGYTYRGNVVRHSMVKVKK